MPYATYEGLRPQVNTPYEAAWSLDEEAYKAYEPMSEIWSTRRSATGWTASAGATTT